MSFPIGCRVTITLFHPKHANTTGTVTQHTAKFVTFTPDDHPHNTISILPQSLTITPPTVAITPPIINTSPLPPRTKAT